MVGYLFAFACLFQSEDKLLYIFRRTKLDFGVPEANFEEEIIHIRAIQKSLNGQIGEAVDDYVTYRYVYF